MFTFKRLHTFGMSSVFESAPSQALCAPSIMSVTGLIFTSNTITLDSARHVLDQLQIGYRKP